MDHSKLWEIPKKIRVPDHYSCLLGNLYAGQKATGRTAHGTTDWFKIGTGVIKAVLSPCLFNFYVAGSNGKESTCKPGDLGLNLGRCPGEGKGYPLQYPCLDNSMDKGAWQATFHEVTESDTTEHLSLSFSCAEYIM